MTEDDRTATAPDDDEFRSELQHWLASQEHPSPMPPADPAALADSQQEAVDRIAVTIPTSPPLPIPPLNSVAEPTLTAVSERPAVVIPDRSPLGVRRPHPGTAQDRAPSTPRDRDPITVGDSAPIAVSNRAPIAAPERAPTVVHDGAPIALDEVLRRLQHVSWVEAVAIVHALCAVLVDAGEREAPVPELSDISITAEGTVLTRGRGLKGLVGPRLARTLHSLTTS